MTTSFQEDDEGVFEAALSFVNEFDFNTGTAISSPSQLSVQRRQEFPPTLNTESAIDDAAEPLSKEEKRRRRAEKKRLLRKAGVYSDPNRARNEQTREIAFLREQMEKLQLDLQALQARKQQSGVKALVAVNTETHRSSLWREQATRQRRRREQAECDNVRLKLAVERQRKVADSLGVLIQKRTRQLNNECASLINQCCVDHPAIAVLDFCGDVRDFRGLFCLLDEAYRDMDTTFAANGLATMSIPIGDVHMREDVDGKYLEFFTYKDLPFGLQDTAQVSWDYFKGAEKHMAYGNLYEKAAKNLDEPYTVIEEFRKEVYSNNSRADVKMRQVVRRYVEADRDVVVRVSHAAPIEVKNKIALELKDGVTYDPKNVRALTDFLIVHGLKNTVVHCEFIENALADHALRRRIA
ncbi:hypothetical protein PR003_g6403 [Phytophthora rubi]|uniref:Uncharacterized protein n=1 Tax=Phytophthora rubi TaxID=129364 RepID=A0A6A4FSI8_9STRA|nr:hypothetical protein PR002_g6647 [Phytophthora rubi]KAE9051471.1 hypothetical protein PR001_g1415 [Phytophthora rubi]KAE9348481.1 hypothetical protein PR003_g6403 [Phytophthora rubi]